jgi:hypothetical protein
MVFFDWADEGGWSVFGDACDIAEIDAMLKLTSNTDTKRFIVAPYSV